MDLLTIAHEGERIEGIGRHYSSSTRGVFWGHLLTAGGLVFAGFPNRVFGAFDAARVEELWPQG